MNRTEIELKKLAKRAGGYSLSDAVQSALRTGGAPTGLEGEISQELQLNNHGEGTFRAPFWAFEAPSTRTTNTGSRDLTAGTATDGAELVAADVRDAIPVLRPESIVGKLGVRVETGLVGDIRFPRTTTGTSVAWAGNEVTTAYSESEPQWDEITLTPNHVGSTTQYSKQLLTQSGGGLERTLRGDISAGLTEAVDVALCQGAGTGGVPTGITATSGVLTSTISTASTPSKAELWEFIEDVEAANALSGNLAWVVTPAIAGYLRQTLVDASIAGNLMDTQTGNILGQRAMIHSGLASGRMIFGDWSKCVVCIWGDGIDFTVDPYTNAKNRLIDITSNLMVDLALLQPAAMSVNTA